MTQVSDRYTWWLIKEVVLRGRIYYDNFLTSALTVTNVELCAMLTNYSPESIGLFPFHAATSEPIYMEFSMEVVKFIITNHY